MDNKKQKRAFWTQMGQTYYQANRERMLAYAREYREKNREAINAKQRARYAAKPEYRAYQRNYQAAYYKQYGRDQRKGYQ